jgi:hypothetical protein
MMVNTLDGVEVEVTHCDAGYAPGSKPGLLLNTVAVWFKPLGGEWLRSRHRSAIRTATDIRHSKASDLHLISDRKLITTEESHDPKENKDTSG